MMSHRDARAETVGDVLYVPGIAASILRSPQGTSAFRSTVPSADAHIRDALLRVNCTSDQQQQRALHLSPSVEYHTPPRQVGGQLSPAGGSSGRRDTQQQSSVRAQSPSASSSPSARRLGSASFRSKTPTACAHIRALPSPVDPVPIHSTGAGSSSKRPSASFLSSTSKADAHIRSLNQRGGSGGFVPRSDFDVGKSPISSASFKSSTPSACAHIKALNKPGESTALPPSEFDDISRHKNELSASYRSNTSIADAHIRALQKPVDVCMAFTQP